MMSFAAFARANPLRLFARLSLGARVTCTAVLGGAVAVAASTWWTISTLEAEQHKAAQRSLEVNLGVLKDQVQRHGTTIRVEGDRMIVGETALNGRNEIVDAVKEIAGGVATLFLGDLRIATNVVRPDGTRGVGTRLAPGPAFDASITRGQTYRGENDILGRRHLTIYEPIRDAAGRQIGLWFVGVPIADLDAMLWVAKRDATLAALAALALAGLLIAVVVRRSLAPVLALRDATLRVAEGKHDAQVPCTDRRDVVGELARAVETLRTTSEEAAAARAALDAERTRAAEERRAARVTLADRFEAQVMAAVSAVADAVARLRGSADAIAESASGTVSLSTEVTGASDRAATGVNAVAAAAEELSTSIREIGRQVTEAAAVARAAAEESARTNASVGELSAAAARIGDVVRLINDIAGQTNLLALNATIEAARAGEAGKGFAVVASEVKNLASQTAKATEEIGAQINAMQAATGGAVDAIRAIGGRIDQISGLASAVAAAVEQQGAATAEIARSVQDAAAGTGEVSGAIRRVADNATRAAEASATVRGEAGRLDTETGTMRGAVEGFLKELRAA
jgi:methyl-accepting chemotaxis protein